MRPGQSSQQPVVAPYEAQAELVDDQLAACRRRLSEALERAERNEPVPAATTWPPRAVIADEQRIDARLEQGEASFPIVELARAFSLTPTEERVVWLLIAHELCPLVRAMMRSLSTERGTEPSSDVLRRVVHGARFSPAAWLELSAEGTLRRYGLIERVDEGTTTPEHRQTWKVSSRTIAVVYGITDVDPTLDGIARLQVGAQGLSDLALSEGAADAIRDAIRGDGIVVVQGRCGSGRRSSLVAATHERGRRVLCIDGKALSRDRDLARSQLRALARECRLLGLTPLVRDLDALAGVAEVPDRIDLLELELAGLVLATSARPIGRRWHRPPTTIELAPLGTAQLAEQWRTALPTAGDGDAQLLANVYPLAPALIHATGRVAVDSCGAEPMTPCHIERALRTVLDDRLAGLATRVAVTQTWEDLVLPDDQMTAIDDLLARVRERSRVYEEWGFEAKLGRGLGLAALFSGPPGTGKTMAAGLIARTLRVDLYQVDLSKVVSKWIGETEKNLGALFDAAEAGHAVLLFDEADALFGKRTEVRTSNDRHANQEVNYLLQRLEAFRGICILTTNHESAIDEAFRRRLTAHVRFPLPDEDERAALWRAMLPPKAPTAPELAIAALAKTYAMSGGYIRNAVVRAAFLAADERGR